LKIVASDEALPELAEYLAPFAQHFVRSEGRNTLERYSTGLLSDIRRKNGTAIADAIPATTNQRLQSLLTGIQWDEDAFNTQRVQQLRDGVRLGNGVLIVDDTGFPKQGHCSVGVARQYCGELGKVDNCQVCVTCHYADSAVSWPVNARLYLPQEWTDDKPRLAQAGVPETVTFQTKPQIALALIEQALRLNIPHEAVVTDASYGGDDTFLSGLEARGERYVVAVPCDFFVLPADRPNTRPQRADTLMRQLPKRQWRTIRWREGTKGWLKKKFVALRVYRVLDGEAKRLGWLIGERPGYRQRGEWKFYFSDFLADTPLEQMVCYVHHRWHIDRFYQDAKQELGWGDYQGRKWIGFHRHATLVMLTYSFLVTLEWKYRCSRPPTRGRPRHPFSSRRDGKRQSLQQIHQQVIDMLWKMAMEYHSRK
jgi:SRSO17 transposase